MATKEAMHSLTQEILSSYEARAADIATLHKGGAVQRQATRTHIRGLNEAHGAMAQQLHSGLTQGRAGLARSENKRKSGVNTWLNSIAGTHRAMALQLHSGLADSRSGLANSEEQRKSEVNAWLKSISDTHRSTAQQLHSSLDKSRMDLAKLEEQRKSGVNTWFKGITGAHQAMAQQLRSVMAKSRTDLAQSGSRRRLQTGAWLKGMATAHTEAREDWQNMTAILRAKRKTQAGVPVPQSGEVGEDAAQPKPEKMATEPGALRDRIFAYLADHPDGTRLTELEQEFGEARIQVAKVLRGLMDSNKVEKREMLYFAI